MSSADQTVHFPKQVTQHRADSYSNRETFAMNAMIRALEEGHHSFFRKDDAGTYFDVVSDADLDDEVARYDSRRKHYRITLGYIPRQNLLVHFTCTCKSGENRPHLPVPCKHAALVGRRLVRDNLLIADGSLFRVSEILLPKPESKTCTCGETFEGKGSKCGRCLLESM